MHVFSPKEIHTVFFYNFNKFATVFCFNVFFEKRATKNFENIIIAI